MRNIKATWKRLASFALAAILVLGTLAMGAPTAEAASTGGDFTVLYAGNTYQAPGDIVTVRGSNVAAVASKEILVVRLEDTGADSVGYIDRTWFDYDGVHEGEHTIAPTDPDHIDWSKAMPAEVVHVSYASDQSVQFILPEYDADGNVMEHGIFAVKLSTNTMSTVIYINAPSIDYVLGSDGSFASAGTLLEVVGENIAPCQNANEDAWAAYKRYKDRTPEDLRAVLISADGQTQYELEIADITSDYNIVVKIPDEIDDSVESQWELYIYNGYGDNTAWSIPTTVTINKAWADRIPDNFINIKDYGAEGYYQYNATPIIQQCLNLLEEMGGGTLYLPEGAYRVQYTIYVPDNVRILGDGSGETNIDLVCFNNNYNNMINSVFVMGNNNEVSGVAFHLKRVRTVFNTFGTGTSNNIRLDDLKFYTKTESWSNNGEAPGAPLIGRFDLYKYNESRVDEGCAFITGRYNNLRVTNVNAEGNANCVPVFNCYNSRCAYLYAENIQAPNTAGDGWNRSIFNYAVYKNCEFGGCMASEGYNVYQYEVKFGPSMGYNREITVADLDGGNGYVYKVHTEEGLDASDSVYLEVYDSASNRLDCTGWEYWVTEFMQIYVQAAHADHNGTGAVDPGFGQTRIVVGIDKERNCLIVNRPWADTTFGLEQFYNTRRPRENIYWVDCEFYEGACGGSFYGGCCDVVLDGSHREYNYNAYQYVKNGDCNWYMSIINECWEDTAWHMVASYGVVRSCSYMFKVQNRNYGQVGFVIRNCDIYSEIKMDNYNLNMMADFVFDNNRFIDMEYVFNWDKNGIPDGMTIYRCVGDSLVQWGTGSITDMKTNNVLTMLVDGLGAVESTMLGDANGDGWITELDVTYIQKALAGEVILLAANSANSDLDGDGEVTPMDAIYLRYYLEGIIDKFPVEADTDTPDMGDSGNGAFTPGYH